MSLKLLETPFKILILLSFLFLTDCSNKNSPVENNPSEAFLEVTPGSANLVAGSVSLQFSALIKNASGGLAPDTDLVWTSGDQTIFTVDQNGLAKGIKVGVALLTVSSGSLSAQAIIGVVSANKGASNITLFGKVSYEDQPFDKNGFTGKTELPVRKALVEIVAIDSFKVIATGASNNFGDFSLTADNSGQRGGIYLRVISASDPADASKIEIRNNPEDRTLYAFASPGMNDSTANPFSRNQNLLAKTGGAGGAFNLFDVYLDASEFIRKSGPCPEPSPDCQLPLLTSYWEPGSTEGTFFVSPQNEIFVLGGGESGDADEYDDSVILHEFGHFVLSQFSKDDSPGGRHTLSDNDQDIRLSWSEGWANFFSSAVRGTPVYVDTRSGGLGLSFNIEDYTTTPPSSLRNSALYTTSEIAVAGVLWDLFDSINSPNENDPIALGFGKIWQTTMSFPSLSPATMETFWLKFEDNALTAPDVIAFQTIMKGRKIELFPDATTPPPSLNVNGTTNGTMQHRTIYSNAGKPDNDEDIIPLMVNKGVSYTIETFNLTNGADTFLTIKEQNTIVGQNDNASGLSFSNCSTCPPNGRTNLASSVSFVWTGVDTQLNAHIQHSSSAPPSAGLFGAYDIKVTLSQ